MCHAIPLTYPNRAIKIRNYLIWLKRFGSDRLLVSIQRIFCHNLLKMIQFPFILDRWSFVRHVGGHVEVLQHGRPYISYQISRIFDRELFSIQILYRSQNQPKYVVLNALKEYGCHFSIWLRIKVVKFEISLLCRIITWLQTKNIRTSIIFITTLISIAYQKKALKQRYYLFRSEFEELFLQTFRRTANRNK